MRIKLKIITCNIIIVCIPILLTLIFGAIYTLTTDFDNSKPAKFQNIYNKYKKELSNVDWVEMSKKDFSSPNMNSYAPDEQLIKELHNSDVHLKIVLNREILFSNFTSSDDQVFSTRLKNQQEMQSCFVCYEDKYLVFDLLEKNGKKYEIMVIYDVYAADSKVRNSFVPVYMVPTYSMGIFIVMLILSIIVGETIITVWLEASVLNPLELFRKETTEIANGNLNHELKYEYDDEFFEVGQDFEKMRKSLKEAEARQSKYEENRKNILLGISHDLRSPLTSVKGYACGLRDGIAKTEEKKQIYYDAILTRTTDMERMTTRLSDLLRFDIYSSIMKFEPVDLKTYLEDFFKEKDSLIQGHCVDLDLDIPENVRINIDVFEMKRVLTNLVENTIKYRIKDHSFVTIKVKKKNGELQIVYKDDGPGVAEEHLELIFESFYRVDESRTEPAKGSGLGLAIVKKIIEGHRGTIRAFTDNGLGFVVTLPLDEEEKKVEENFNC